jgi:hypothetical protein
MKERDELLFIACTSRKWRDCSESDKIWGDFSSSSCVGYPFKFSIKLKIEEEFDCVDLTVVGKEELGSCRKWWDSHWEENIIGDHRKTTVVPLEGFDTM